MYNTTITDYSVTFSNQNFCLSKMNKKKIVSQIILANKAEFQLFTSALLKPWKLRTASQSGVSFPKTTMVASSVITNRVQWDLPP